jgi:hypothetical protein
VLAQLRNGICTVWLAHQAGSLSWPLWILVLTSFASHLYNFELFPNPPAKLGKSKLWRAISFGSSRSTGSVRADATNDATRETVATETSSLLPPGNGSTIMSSGGPCSDSLLLAVDLGYSGRRYIRFFHDGDSVLITFDIASTWIKPWTVAR